MRKIKRIQGILFLSMLLWALPTLAAPVNFTPAEQCKVCHAEIYKAWSQSLHANALKDPIFEIAYYKALANMGETARKYCISCHSPTTRYSQDYFLKQKISQEGVTCDFCHRINAVKFGMPLPEVTLGKANIKYGLMKNPESSPTHKSESLELFGRAEYCASCHEVHSPLGAPVMETYSEWKAGPYPKDNIYCQNCHMSKVEETEEKPVAAAEGGKPALKLYSDHLFLGGHSQIRLSKAATLATRTEVKGGKVKVICLVTNKESGHKIPTGIPLRRITLEVVLLSKEGKEIAKKNVVYQKVLVDAAGKVLTDPAEMILTSARIASDNRIAPKEQREERFDFDLSPEVNTFTVDSRLRYEFETAVLTAPQKMIIDMTRDTTIGERPTFMPHDVKKAVLMLLVVFLAGVLVTFVVMMVLKRNKGRAAR